MTRRPQHPPETVINRICADELIYIA